MLIKHIKSFLLAIRHFRFGKGHMLKDTKFLFPRIQLSGPGEAGQCEIVI